nr:hypothetical protein [Tanacetum cinerariifolium]
DIDDPFSFVNLDMQTPGSGISILLAVGTPSTGSGNLYCQWELSPGSRNALCILFPTKDRAAIGVLALEGSLNGSINMVSTGVDFPTAKSNQSYYY